MAYGSPFPAGMCGSAHRRSGVQRGADCRHDGNYISSEYIAMKHIARANVAARPRASVGRKPRSTNRDAGHLRGLLAALIANGEIERERASRRRRPLDAVAVGRADDAQSGGSAPPVTDQVYGVRPPDAKRFWK